MRNVFEALKQLDLKKKIEEAVLEGFDETAVFDLIVEWVDSEIDWAKILGDKVGGFIENDGKPRSPERKAYRLLLRWLVGSQIAKIRRALES